MNKLTIQINNLEALERLIGGDSEVEVEIRNSVIQNFAEKHLKPLANCDVVTSTMRKITENIQTQTTTRINAEIATFKKDYYGNVSEIKLNPSVQTEMERQIRNKMDTFIFDTINTAIQKCADEIKIDERIEKRVAYFTDEYIREEVKKRIENIKKTL